MLALLSTEKKYVELKDIRIGIQEGKERDKGTEKVFEAIMAENFPKLKKAIEIQVKESTESPKQTYTKTYYNQNVKS